MGNRLACLNNPIALSNSVWGIDFELQDVNADGDSMPDWWELEHFGSTNETDSGDYDSDAMPNAWEHEYGFDPAEASDAMDDIDGDGYPNVYEYIHETDPTSSGAPDGGSQYVPTPTITVTTNGGIAPPRLTKRPSTVATALDSRPMVTAMMPITCSAGISTG